MIVGGFGSHGPLQDCHCSNIIVALVTNKRLANSTLPDVFLEGDSLHKTTSVMDKTTATIHSKHTTIVFIIPVILAVAFGGVATKSK